MKLYQRVVCADGASVSLQAGRCQYSSPREEGAQGYTAVDAGFPSVVPPASWDPYRDAVNGEPVTESIYAYLPASCVRDFLTAHGGMVSGECPPLRDARGRPGNDNDIVFAWCVVAVHVLLLGLAIWFR